MKCKDCSCYKDRWCTMVTDSPDPDMERDCAHFIRANKWIPMREQNPEKHGTYLVWDGKEMNTAKWFCVDVPSHGIKAGWSESMPEGGTYPPFPWRVTHWMPLPEPPESEDGASVKAAGWKCVGQAGGLRWTGKRRPEVDLYPAQMKIKFEIEDGKRPPEGGKK